MTIAIPAQLGLFAAADAPPCPPPCAKPVRLTEEQLDTVVYGVLRADGVVVSNATAREAIENLLCTEAEVLAALTTMETAA